MVETINMTAQNPTGRTVTIQAPQAVLPARIPQAAPAKKTKDARIMFVTATESNGRIQALAHLARKIDVVQIVTDRRNKRNTSRVWKKC
jgi:hypothetical protein